MSGKSRSLKFFSVLAAVLLLMCEALPVLAVQESASDEGQDRIPCGQCSTDGVIFCEYCGGMGKTAVGNFCFLCNGVGFTPCQTCSGTGYITQDTWSGQPEPQEAEGDDCPDCDDGKQLCTYCGGKGSTWAGNICFLCNQTGYVNCQTCGGTGVLRKQAAKPDVDKSSLKPGDVCPYCDGGKLVCSSCCGAGKTWIGNICYLCNQTGYQNCLTCHGTGSIQPEATPAPEAEKKPTGRQVMCSFCHGSGTDGDCWNCHGTGTVEHTEYTGGFGTDYTSFSTAYEVCPLCIAGRKKCSKCGGTGFVDE